MPEAMEMMPLDEALESMREGMSEREDSLKVFEVFSGTGTPGEGGEPDVPGPGDEDPGVSVPDGLAVGSFANLGLAGISYGLSWYTGSNTAKVKAATSGMSEAYSKLRVNEALSDVEHYQKMTTLYKHLPAGVGTAVKRMNIDALWDEVRDAMKVIEPLQVSAREAIDTADSALESLHTYSTAGYKVFGAVGGMGLVASGIAGFFHDRSLPLLHLFSQSSGGDGKSEDRLGAAIAEFSFRSDNALSELDSALFEVKEAASFMPDLQEILDLIADAEDLLEPIEQIRTDISELIEPYNDFRGLGSVFSAPLSGLLNFFENPPKILPTIEYKVITPGFHIWVPDPTWSNPFRTKKVWVPPIKGPVPGFTELFNPIPRAEVQKIIDLIVGLVGLPFELLETALSPILAPIQSVIDSIMQPILEKLNPFKEFIGDFNLAELTLGQLGDKIGALVEDFKVALDKVIAIDTNISPVEEIGELDPNGMTTYFGADASEKIIGVKADEGGGFMNGAVLQGNGGNDKIVGTNKDDVLGGGDGQDVIRAKGGDDVVLAGNGRDLVLAGSGSDVVMGGEGKDTLNGGRGKDLLDGGAADDVIKGGDGNDTVIGGTGNDTLEGNGGKDTFRFLKNGSGIDEIVDFVPGDDKIEIEGRRFKFLDIQQDGDDTTIAFGDETIILKDFTGTLEYTDFA